MSELTVFAVESAFESVRHGHKLGARILSDGGARSCGRLLLRIAKPRAGHMLAVWVAQQHYNGKRKSRRLGSYPEISLAQARAIYRSHFVQGLASGADLGELDGPFKRAMSGTGTLRDLCETYVEQLHKNGQPSWKQVERILLGGSGALCVALDGAQSASEVKPVDIVAWLGLAYRRGKKVLAAHQRAVAHAAFQYGMTSEMDYRTVTAERKIRFDLNSNPVHGVAWDEESYVPRQRFLSPAELAAFWKWLVDRGDSHSVAARLMILLGCRVQEVTRLDAKQVDRSGKVIRWGKTKSGRPHSLPLSGMAWELVSSLPVKGELFDFGCNDSKRDAIAVAVRAFVKKTKCEPFQARDLRRTWRTLAGLAGISRDDCALIQNHAPAVGVVGWRVYDKAERLDEKLLALNRWNEWLSALVGASLPKSVPTT